jgi:hypothetical protein
MLYYVLLRFFEVRILHMVLASFILLWFKTRFDHKGSFQKLNLVPLNKFWQENVIRFVEFKLKCKLLFDHSRFCFLDEKHLVGIAH